MKDRLGVPIKLGDRIATVSANMLKAGTCTAILEASGQPHKVFLRLDTATKGVASGGPIERYPDEVLLLARQDS